MDCFYNILCYITQLSNSRCLKLSINWITLQLEFRSSLNFHTQLLALNLYLHIEMKQNYP